MDLHSYARPDRVRVEHVDLDLHVDFDRRNLDGTASLSLKRYEGAE